MARTLWASLLVGAAACVEPTAVDCGDGRVCPAGKACATTTVTPSLCVEPQQLVQCKDQPRLTPCTAVPDGRCYDGVCQASGCGNGYVDDDTEACDDHNTVSGDGCSAECRSTEVCGNGLVDLIHGEQCDDGDTIAHDGCSSVCMDESLAWTVYSAQPPPARETASLAYDAARARVVMFGGDDYGYSSPNQTWEWDGKSWISVPTSLAPQPRSGAGMVYSPAHKRVILFGGTGEVGFFDDTWAWDGTSWTQLVGTTRPPKRAYHKLVYDAAHQRVLMYGGQAWIDDPELSDTWALVGDTWTKLNVSGPGVRVRYGMAYDPTRDTTILVGGYVNYSGPEPLIDTWELDDAGWHLRDSNGPFLESEVEIAFEPNLGKLVMFGNHSGDVTTRAWNGTSWGTVSAATAPSKRTANALVTDTGNRRLLLFGGVEVPITASPAVYGDTWVLDPGTWTQVPSKQWPSARRASAISPDLAPLTALMFGGFDTSGTALADTWQTDQRNWSLRLPNTSPPARGDHGMATDLAHGNVVMFGGLETSPANALRGDTWLWTGSDWTNPSGAGPGARRVPSMAYDAARKQVVLFGGETGSVSDPAETNGFLDDTWIWNGTSWEPRTPAAAPDQRYGAAMAYDPIRERIVLFGGEGYGGDREDTWEWDGTTWTQRAMFGPLKRHRAAMAWDPTRRALVLFGGQTQTIALDDAWEWNGELGTWNLLAPGTLKGRSELGMISGFSGGVFVFAGKLSNTPGDFTDESALLRWDNAVPDENCMSTGIDADGDSLAGCSDSDCWPTCTPSCPPLVSCDPNAPRCGDGVCSEIETCQACPADCTCTPVCGDYRCDPGESSSCPGDC